MDGISEERKVSSTIAVCYPPGPSIRRRVPSERRRFPSNRCLQPPAVRLNNEPATGRPDFQSKTRAADTSLVF